MSIDKQLRNCELNFLRNYLPATYNIPSCDITATFALQFSIFDTKDQTLFSKSYRSTEFKHFLSLSLPATTYIYCCNVVNPIFLKRITKF